MALEFFLLLLITSWMFIFIVTVSVYHSSFVSILDPFVIDEVDDHPSSRWAGRSPRSSDPSVPQPKGSQKKKKKRKKKEKEEETGKRDRKGQGKNRQPKQSSRDCRVEKREMRVRDLGLGFDSDEIVLFKFCVGSCQSSRTNYDLALKALLKNGSLPRRTARKVSSHPCCRPDQYEPVSFMDAQTTWRTIQSLSAASCMCMGWRGEERRGWRGGLSPILDRAASGGSVWGWPGHRDEPQGGAGTHIQQRVEWRPLVSSLWFISCFGRRERSGWGDSHQDFSLDLMLYLQKVSCFQLNNW